MGVIQPVLNGGEIELVDYLGTEEQMIGIARISHGQILPHTSDQLAQRLINYLSENHHTSPFEFIETTWRWRLPIFVARQVIRHRTANVNEQSARYSELTADLYIPEKERILGQDTKNKQGSSGELSDSVRETFLKSLASLQATSKYFYGEFLERGISKELARVHLPVGVYTNWVWKMDLHNLFHFLGLRLDSHAQYEVRVYAEAMAKVLKEAYPMCWDAFEEYKLHARNFSRTDVKLLAKLVADHLSRSPEDRENKMFAKVISLLSLSGDPSEQKSSSDQKKSN